MKVVGFNGSPRRDGNTAILIQTVFAELEKEGIETELVQFSGQTLRGCTACYACKKNQNKQCVIQDDVVNDAIQKMCEADGILIGSPCYFSDINAETKAFIDRVGMVTRTNGNLLKRKVGAAIIAARRSGQNHAFDSINHLFLVGEMIIAGSNYWNTGIGREIGEVNQDEEGITTMRVLGQNMAWLLKRLQS
jgi:multimeric flavodoxin WrbA